ATARHERANPILDSKVQIRYFGRAARGSSQGAPVKQDVPTSEIIDRDYRPGFVTDIESENIPAGLSEDVVRLISTKKKEPQWLLDWRLKAYRHWLPMTEPSWQNVHYPPIDYQSIVYYSAPKQKKG